jgi:hypothetical protein
VASAWYFAKNRKQVEDAHMLRIAALTPKIQ